MVVKEIKGAQNRVRYTMNGFVIAVGSYVKPLFKQAKAAARQIGVVSVDVGETACNVPVATAYIEKIEASWPGRQKTKNHSLLGVVLEQLRRIPAHIWRRGLSPFGMNKPRPYNFGRCG